MSLKVLLKSSQLLVFIMGVSEMVQKNRVIHDEEDARKQRKIKADFDSLVLKMKHKRKQNSWSHKL
jgi:hypothetical protein